MRYLINALLLEGETTVSTNIISEVTTFLTQALVWMGQILTWIVGQPLIMFFLAVGFAGVMFRWARRVVHF